MNSNYDSNIRYRISVEGVKQINNVIDTYQNLNTIKSIFKTFVSNLDKTKMKLYKKKVYPDANVQNVIYHYYGRVSTETKLNSLPDELVDLEDLNFMCLGRMINRKKYVLKKTKTYQLSLDCSEILNLISLKDINKNDVIYDVELDVDEYIRSEEEVALLEKLHQNIIDN